MSPTTKEPVSARVMVRLTYRDSLELRQVAARERRDLSALLRIIIMDWLEARRLERQTQRAAG